MTMIEAGDHLARAVEGWLGKLVMMILLGVCSYACVSVWEAIQATQEAVVENGRSEARLEGKFDELTKAVTSFQTAAAAQRALDERQTADLAEIRAGQLRLEQRVEDHIRVDAALVAAGRKK